MHPSEKARLSRQAEAHRDEHGLFTSVGPAPGSIEEYEALAAIDEARYDEQQEISGRAGRRRRRRMSSHWSDRQRQLEGT